MENREKSRDKMEKTRDVLGEIGETQRNIAKISKGSVKFRQIKKLKEVLM